MRRTRRAYTLLEVLLALAIAVMLLGAVYAVIGYQLRYAQSGRDLVEKTVLARAILQRMSGDVSSAIALGDPARFRRQQTTTDASAPPTGGATGDAAAAGAAAGASSTVTTSPPVQLPLGVIGTSTELHLFVSKLPPDGTGDGPPVCDVRRISYWVPDESEGLCRMEMRLVTSEDATNTTLPGDVSAYHFAAEVKAVEFGYLDGTSWVDSWDSTELGQDGKTPKGSPRAIQIKISVQMPGQSGAKTYRHVVHVMTAGGTPKDSSTEAGTTTP